MVQDRSFAVRADPRRPNTEIFSRDSAILLFDYAIFDFTVNLLHPDFSGVRWVRDQPMPGPFPDRSHEEGKRPGNEVDWSLVSIKKPR